MKTHNPLYYITRTIVRCAFWLGITILIGLGITALVDDRPTCEVKMTPQGWTWDGTPVALDTCVHPSGVVLSDDGTWHEASGE